MMCGARPSRSAANWGGRRRKPRPRKRAARRPEQGRGKRRRRLKKAVTPRLGGDGEDFQGPGVPDRQRSDGAQELMLRFAANLTWLFQEWPFLDRFAAAADAGFTAVEYLFPYDHPPEDIA